MNYLARLIQLIKAFRAETRQDAITPDSLGSLLHKMEDMLRLAWGAATHPCYHIECDTKDGRLIVEHPTDLTGKGYVPYLLRHSKKKPRYRNIIYRETCYYGFTIPKPVIRKRLSIIRKTLNH